MEWDIILYFNHLFYDWCLKCNPIYSFDFIFHFYDVTLDFETCDFVLCENEKPPT